MIKFSYAAIPVALVLFWSGQVLAAKSSDSITVSGSVPLVLQANALRISDYTYQVHEISNNSDGYLVEIETDSSTIKYAGQNILFTNGQSAILTQVFSQDKSIDSVKVLELNSKASFVRVSIRANQ